MKMSKDPLNHPIRVILWHRGEYEQFPTVQQFFRWCVDELAESDTPDVWYVDLVQQGVRRSVAVGSGLWQLMDPRTGFAVCRQAGEPLFNARQRLIATSLERGVSLAFTELDSRLYSATEWATIDAPRLFSHLGYTTLEPVGELAGRLHLCPELVDEQTRGLSPEDFGEYITTVEARVLTEFSFQNAGMGDDDRAREVDRVLEGAMPAGVEIMRQVEAAVMDEALRELSR